MTIEINVPIKCSTVKKVNKIFDKVFESVIGLLILLMYPGAIIALIIIMIAIGLGIGDPKIMVELFLLVDVVSIPLTIVGYLLYTTTKPFKINCIQDGVS